MATVITNTIQNMLREELGPSVRETLPKMDSVWENIWSTSMGVTRDPFGAGGATTPTFSVYHTLSVSGVAGAFQWKGAFSGGASSVQLEMHQSTASKMRSGFVYGAVSSQNSFPGINESTNPAVIRSRMELVYGVGNLAFPIQILTLDEMDAAVLKYVAHTIKLTARLLAIMDAQSFFMTDAYGTVAMVHTVTADSNAHTTIVVDGGQVNLFYPGQLVDIWYVAGGSVPDTKRAPAAGHTNLVMVDGVDYLNHKVSLRAVDGADADLDDVADGDYIIAHGTTPTGGAGTDAAFGGPMGIEDWLLTPDGSGATKFLNVVLDNYPQLGSLVDTSVGVLTNEKLNKYIGAFHEAYKGVADIDTIITTHGVTREMLTQVEDMRVFESQGQAIDLKMGWDSFSYSYGGRKYSWKNSTYVRPGYLYGFKFGDRNIKRYVPPRVPRAGTEKSFDGEVQFMAPIGGSTGIFKHAHNGDGATTEFVEAPFFRALEIAPDQPQGIKLTGLTESNYI